MKGVREKLKILADAAKYDASCASSGSNRKRTTGGLGNTEGMGICHSYTPDGRCVSLLKILLTNYCVYDCLFCINRVSSDTPRARFTVEEVVWLTIEFYKRNYIEGLFLSSGIIQSSDYTMEQLAEVARRLRVDHKFGGYIHLKAIPGASQELIESAGIYCDRLSVNIELPTDKDLQRIAPAKTHTIIESAMAVIRDKVKETKEDKSKFKKVFAPAGQSTQLIVGATKSPDAEILTKASKLYSVQKLRRVYYSAFSPIPHGDPGLPLEKAPLIREHRLYQADWLLRFYGFKVDEITPGASENLNLNIDPKLAWALRNRGLFPVNINSADRRMLLRIPGLGKKNAEKIIAARRFHKLTLEDLARIRVPIDKVRHFIIASNHIPKTTILDSETFLEKAKPKAAQLPLIFSSALIQEQTLSEAISGEF